MVHHATRAQKSTWNADGTAHFGTPVSRGVPLAAPTGELSYLFLLIVPNRLPGAGPLPILER